MIDPIDRPSPPPRQRSARNDPAMRDGDSAHGSPYESAGDEMALDSDTDIGDADRRDESITEVMIDNVLAGETGQQTLSVDPDALDRMADPHAGPDIEAEIDEEEYAQEAADADLPIPDYADLNVGEIADRAKPMSASDVETLLVYEKAHRNRITLVNALEKLLGH